MSFSSKALLHVGHIKSSSLISRVSWLITPQSSLNFFKYSLVSFMVLSKHEILLSTLPSESFRLFSSVSAFLMFSLSCLIGFSASIFELNSISLNLDLSLYKFSLSFSSSSFTAVPFISFSSILLILPVITLFLNSKASKSISLLIALLSSSTLLGIYSLSPFNFLILADTLFLNSSTLLSPNS
ncbi:hypothetical protein SDC9_150857 [bioreactor metagenome]|uniref:Uncharacterized protein n=1 Tax=bioreactor metagenome TaxID=1076179 RepID=A0A645EQA5_9ZZZZ